MSPREVPAAGYASSSGSRGPETPRLPPLFPEHEFDSILFEGSDGESELTGYTGTVSGESSTAEESGTEAKVGWLAKKIANFFMRGRVRVDAAGVAHARRENNLAVHEYPTSMQLIHAQIATNHNALIAENHALQAERAQLLLARERGKMSFADDGEATRRLDAIADDMSANRARMKEYSALMTQLANRHVPARVANGILAASAAVAPTISGAVEYAGGLLEMTAAYHPESRTS